jgi:hypothetical protein
VNISQINGWQRLFIVIGIVLGVITFLEARVPTEQISLEPYLVKMSPKYALSVEKTEGNFAKYFLGENMDEFKTPDGEIHLADKGTLTQEQVNQAYKLASEEASKSYWEKSVKSYSQAIKIYLIAMTALYALGWSIAWIRRGFKK